MMSHTLTSILEEINLHLIFIIIFSTIWDHIKFNDFVAFRNFFPIKALYDGVIKFALVTIVLD